MLIVMRIYSWKPKISLFVWLALGSGLLVTSLPVKAADLRIEIENFKGDKGVAVIFLFEDKNRKNFPLDIEKKAPLCKQTKRIKKQKVLLYCKGIPPGRYALFAFHDENENDQPDHHWYGPPKEAIGFSNQAKPKTFGPPDFDEAAFNLGSEDITINIVLSVF
ncbi:MAG: DUF2141 domain-containing protein [Deltaproteobacteria bacterium]|nr:DUF2141 domain-containing protein [Deltaproteobacteria bacterium]